MKERRFKLFLAAISVAAWHAPLNASLQLNPSSQSQYGRLTRTANPLGQQKVYEYDKMSRVTEVRDPAGNTTTYSYDALNRLTKKDIQTPSGTHAVTSYTYDAVGNTQKKDGQNLMGNVGLKILKVKESDSNQMIRKPLILIGIGKIILQGRSIGLNPVVTPLYQCLARGGRYLFVYGGHYQ
ncbi:MAG: hypothetical protein ACYC4Q_09025 [Victivallaceae bacterium]